MDSTKSRLPYLASLVALGLPLAACGGHDADAGNETPTEQSGEALGFHFGFGHRPHFGGHHRPYRPHHPGVPKPTPVEDTDGSTTLNASRDSTLSQRHPNSNDGTGETLVVQPRKSNVVVAFDLVEGLDVERATLVLTVESDGRSTHGCAGGHLHVSGWRRHGCTGGVSLAAAALREEWTEGAGTSRSGVTWNCPTDVDLGDDAADCDSTWRGGFPAEPVSAKPAGALANRLRTVRLDVTKDVVAGNLVGWVITSLHGDDRIAFYSKEGAEAAGDPTLAPALVLVGPSVQVVGNAGGTIKAPGGVVELDVPRGALAEPTRIDFTELPLESEFPLSGLLAGTLHQFAPDGLVFAVPARLTIAYDPELVPAGIDPSGLAILGAVHEPGAPVVDLWQERPSIADPTLPRITGSIDHFSEYGVGTEGDEIALSAESIMLGPGESRTMSASISVQGEPLSRELTWSTGALAHAQAIPALAYAGFEHQLVGLTPGSSELSVRAGRDPSAAYATTEITISSQTPDPIRRVWVFGTATLTDGDVELVETVRTVVDLSELDPGHVLEAEVGAFGDGYQLIFGLPDGAQDVEVQSLVVFVGNVAIFPQNPATVPASGELASVGLGGAEGGRTLDISLVLQNISPLDRRSTEGACQRWNVNRANLSEGTWDDGDVVACEPGGISSDGRDNALKQVNLYRWLADMHPLRTRRSLNGLAQDCALIMQANCGISHAPDVGCPGGVAPDGTRCEWFPNRDTTLFPLQCVGDSPAQAGIQAAGASNVSQFPGVFAVDEYMVDISDTFLGHRLSILSPFLSEVGLGSTLQDCMPPEQSYTNSGLSCMYKSDRSSFEQGYQTWITWPPPGPVPIEAFSPRDRSSVDEAGWSIQSFAIDLSGSSVTVSQNGSLLGFTLGRVSASNITIFPGWTTEAGATYTVTVAPGGNLPPFVYDVSPVDCDLVP